MREHCYAIFALFLAPVTCYGFMPAGMLGLIYIVVVSAFISVCSWVTIESIAACLARLKRLPCAYQHSSPVAYIVAAYLNNEADILDETLQAYLQLEYRGSIQVLVVYNVKGSSIAQEAGLLQRWHGKQAGNVYVSMVRNFSSSSKAENVNYGLEMLASAEILPDFIAIMDADHQPRADVTCQSVSTLRRTGYDVVQGHCTIRNVTDNLFSGLIAVEFEDMYNVGHEGRSNLFDLGIFGGSNGMWKAEVLQRIRMDGDMLTEDIDSSFRAHLQGYKITYDRDVISSELAPLQLQNFTKQRLRWAQGWFQVSMKHLWPSTRSKMLTRKQKFACFLLFCWREMFPYIIFHSIILAAVHIFKNKPSTIMDPKLACLAFAMTAMSVTRVLAVWCLSQGAVMSHTYLFWMYGLCYGCWTSYLNYLQVLSHGRQIFGIHEWVATVRDSLQNPQQLRQVVVCKHQ